MCDGRGSGRDVRMPRPAGEVGSQRGTRGRHGERIVESVDALPMIR